MRRKIHRLETMPMFPRAPSLLCRAILTLGTTLILAACGGGGGGGGAPATPESPAPPAAPPEPATYAVSGTVSGLAGAGPVVLRNNSSDELTVDSDGPFQFVTRLASASTYEVSVLAHPPGRLCTVSSGSGTVRNADVSSVIVACEPAASLGRLGGTVMVGNVQLTADPGVIRGSISIAATTQPSLPAPLPAGFTQVGPVHSIHVTEQDQDKLNASIKVRLPVPAGWTSSRLVALHYNAKTGAYQPLTVDAIDDASITVESRSFSLYILVDVASLLFNGAYFTGFDPSVDGFNIGNPGFQNLSEGNCLGMSSYASWFFSERRGDGDALAAHFGNDDVELVLSTRAHLAMRQEFAKAQANEQKNLPDVLIANALKAFLRFGPVVVLLEGSAKHAVLAYGFSETGFYVYDPNFPKEPRFIAFDGDFFQPYESGVHLYTSFGILGLPSLGTTDDFGELTEEAEAGFANSDDLEITAPQPGQAIDTPTFSIEGSLTGSVNPESTVVALVDNVPYELHAENGQFAELNVQTPLGRATVIVLAGIPDGVRLSRNDWEAFRESAAEIFEVVGPDWSEGSFSYIEWSVEGQRIGVANPCDHDHSSETCAFGNLGTSGWLDIGTSIGELDGISIILAARMPSFHATLGIPPATGLPSGKPLQSATVTLPIDTVDPINAADADSRWAEVVVETGKYRSDLPPGAPAATHLFSHKFLADYPEIAKPGYLTVTLRSVTIGAPLPAGSLELVDVAKLYAEGTFAFVAADVDKEVTTILGWNLGYRLVHGSYRIEVGTCSAGLFFDKSLMSCPVE